MADESSRWGVVWAIAAILAGIAILLALEVADEPHVTLGSLLYELIEPTATVLTAAGVIYLLQRTKRQHEEQMSLLRDLEVARAEGAQWRHDMRELLKGLGSAIDAQFDRWQLTAAEREVAMLMLKGLSHKE